MAQFSLIRYLHFVAVSLNKSKPWPVGKKKCFDSFSLGFNRPPCDKLKSLQSSV